MKIGILGSGQLARMLTLAAYPFGFSTLCLDPTKNSCASQVTETITADYADEHALKAFLDQVDCVTYETENIPVACAEFISKHRPLYPSADTLQVSQDRLFEKKLFQELGIPTAEFFKIDSLKELKNAITKIGFPVVLKTRRFGYDGKGQYVLKSDGDLQTAAELFSLSNELENAGSSRDDGGARKATSPLILEKWIPFEQEVSIIAVRNVSGEIRFYPLTRNEHQEGILRLSEAPYYHPELETLAQAHAKAVLENLQYVGVLTIEFFHEGERLIANEMAPRVHNSGHWTIEGAQTSQFENHVRAICNLPSTETVEQSAMFNCIGEEPEIEKILKIPGAHYHSYGKSPRPQRKLGHVTLVHPSKENYSESFKKLRVIFNH
jgi:5-(carboxyamino)imidazole ribonucleotide synthase